MVFAVRQELRLSCVVEALERIQDGFFNLRHRYMLSSLIKDIYSQRVCV